MKGQPVWLASISRRRKDGTGPILFVPEWSDSQRRDAEKVLRRTLRGVGNTARERLFRMNVTLCLHRAATDQEVAEQPAWFLTATGCGLAGGPVAVLSETEPGSPSTRPCAHPQKQTLVASNPHAWIPKDCGRCDSCRARARC